MNENQCIVCRCGESKHNVGFETGGVISAHDPQNPTYFVWPYVFCTACKKECAAAEIKFERRRRGEHV